MYPIEVTIYSIRIMVSLKWFLRLHIAKGGQEDMSSYKSMLVEIAKQYYEEGMTQEDIAKRFFMSRAMVSRKLAEARKIGIVNIFIDTSGDTMSELERKLFAAFKLKGICVVPVPENDEDLAVQLTARAGAYYLGQFINPGDRIGVGWGWTLYEMSNYFPQLPFSVSLVCQLTGSVDNAMTRGYANEIIANLYRKVSAREAYSFPCPVMVDSNMISNALRNDLKVNKVLELGKSCNKLFVNIALPERASCLYQAGYINDTDIENLKKNGAIGSICCRFFDENGKACDSSIDDRTMGITIDEISQVDCVMACITGPRKSKALYYALKAKMIDILVVDSITASAVMKLVECSNDIDQ